MRTNIAYTGLSFSSFLLLTNAWPLVPGQPERREPASYSVVAVDGGSSGDGAATTVTDSIVHTETVLKTQLSTIVVTESDTPSTIVVTITSASPTTITEQAAPSISTQTVTSAPESSAQPSRSEDTQQVAPETITVTQPLPTTKAYDDGQWHTYYYYTVNSGTEDSSNSVPSPTQEATKEPYWWGGSEPEPENMSTTVAPVSSSDDIAIPTSAPNVGRPSFTVPFWGGLPNIGPAKPTSTIS